MCSTISATITAIQGAPVAYLKTLQWLGVWRAIGAIGVHHTG
jgi:hypothetical protein